MTGILIDDDPLVVQTIAHFVEKSDLVEGCEYAGDGAAAVNRLATGGIDFVLLDLHLPDLPGQTVLQAVSPGVPVVVVSSDPGFGAASYQFPNVVDYLVKPVDYVEFHRALERVGEFRAKHASEPARPPVQENRKKVIFVKSGNEIVRLALDEVRWIKAEANYVSFHLDGQSRPVMTLTTLKYVASELPPNFLRVHRSYIVNRDHIERVDGQLVHIGEAKIPIGESYRSEFLGKLGIIA